MSHLKLVEKPELPPVEKVRQRVRTMVRPDGILQCKRCGCRASMSIVCGAYIKDGRIQPGTKIEQHICSECYKRGVIVSMLPEMVPVK